MPHPVSSHGRIPPIACANIRGQCGRKYRLVDRHLWSAAVAAAAAVVAVAVGEAVDEGSSVGLLIRHSALATFRHPPYHTD